MKRPLLLRCSSRSTIRRSGGVAVIFAAWLLCGITLLAQVSPTFAMVDFFSSIFSSTPESDECLAEPESGEAIASGSFGSVQKMQGHSGLIVKTVAEPAAYEEELAGADLALEFVLLEGKAHEVARRRHLLAPVMVADPEGKREASSHCEKKRYIYYPLAVGMELGKTTGKFPPDVHGVYMLVTILVDLVRTVFVMAEGRNSDTQPLWRKLYHLVKKPQGAERGITHNDIKGDNIFFRVETMPETGLRVPVVTLIDLGLVEVKGTRLERKLYMGTMTPSMAARQSIAHPFEDLFRIGHLAVHLLTGRNPVFYSLEIARSLWPERGVSKRTGMVEWVESFHDDEGQMKDLGGSAHEGWVSSHHKEWESWWTKASLTARTAQQFALVRDAKEWILKHLYSSERDPKKWDASVQSAFERGELLLGEAMRGVGSVGSDSWEIVQGLKPMELGRIFASGWREATDGLYEELQDTGSSSQESHESHGYEPPVKDDSAVHKSSSLSSSHISHSSSQGSLMEQHV